MKKTLAFLLVAVLVFSQMSVFAATVPGTVYSDETAAGANKPVAQITEELALAGIQDVKPTDWFAGSVTVLVETGLMAPEADGTFQPEATLDTSTGVAVFAKVLGIASTTDTPEVALQKAQQAGLVEETAAPQEDLSRLGVARMLAKALGVTVVPVTSQANFPFNEFNSLSAEDRGILKALFDLGIFKGFTDGTFRPGDTLTKAQLALLVDRIITQQA